MEVNAGASFRKNVDELLDILRELIRLKPQLKMVLPEDLSRIKERLKGLLPRPGTKYADYDLFYRIGLVLQRQQQPVSMGDLGEMLRVPLSTATRMVDWLVENGFVHRLPDAKDRRVVRISLSRNGNELYETITDFMREKATQILKEFNDEERKVLVPLLRKLLTALEALLG